MAAAFLKTRYRARQVFPDSAASNLVNTTNIVCVGVPERSSSRLPNLPDLMATTGPDLMEELDRWLDCLLQEHFKRPNSEHNYIYALKGSAGRNHPIHTLMEAVLEDPEYEGRKIEEHAVWVSRKATKEFQAHCVKDGMMKYLELACDQYYPAFEIPRVLMQMIANTEFELSQTDVKHSHVKKAEQELQMLERELERLEVEHNTRDAMAKYRYICSHPVLKVHTNAITEEAKLLRQADKDRRDQFGEGSVEYENQQYKQVTDFAGLMWLRGFILIRLGAINAIHVRRFEQLRMLSHETPLQAFTRVKREGELIQAAKIGSFNLEIALHDLVTRAEHADGHSFFTKALYNHAYSIVQSQLLTNKVSEDNHVLCTETWVNVADRLYRQEVGRETPLDIRVRKELKDHDQWHSQQKRGGAGPPKDCLLLGRIPARLANGVTTIRVTPTILWSVIHSRNRSVRLRPKTQVVSQQQLQQHYLLQLQWPLTLLTRC
jgi:hypothetical protein